MVKNTQKTKGFLVKNSMILDTEKECFRYLATGYLMPKNWCFRYLATGYFGH